MDVNKDGMLPCPFCGDPGELRVTFHWAGTLVRDYTPRCTMPGCPGRLSKKWTSRERALALWNSRIPDKKALDALEEILNKIEATDDHPLDEKEVT